MELRQISWKSNPAKLKDDIDYNFQLIASSFNGLLDQKFFDIKINSLASNEIKLGHNSIDELFILKNGFTELRVLPGNNIVTGGTKTGFTISVSENPQFINTTSKTVQADKIFVDGKDVKDLFYSRSEMSAITFPVLSKNFTYENNQIDLAETISPKIISANSVTAITASFAELNYMNRPIHELFGSHTFILEGDNIITGGTPYNPIVSVTSHPKFQYIHSESAMISGMFCSEITGNTVSSTRVSSNVIDAKEKMSVGSNFHVSNNVNIGCVPEPKISTFSRTKVRIMSDSMEPTYHSLLIQSRNGMARRSFNDNTVDMVVKGDGSVGIGAFENLNSKLTIHSEGGHDQLQLKNDFTPDGTKDIRGNIGNIAWNDEYIFIKTKQGWKRSTLSFF